MGSVRMVISASLPLSSRLSAECIGEDLFTIVHRRFDQIKSEEDITVECDSVPVPISSAP